MKEFFELLIMINGRYYFNIFNVIVDISKELCELEIVLG